MGITAKGITFPNLRSRLLVGRMFRRQYILPEPPPRWMSMCLKWYERAALDIDLTDVHVDRPVFVIGLPRSGTSLLQEILCAHPMAAYVTNAMNSCRESMCGIEHLRKRFELNARGERYLKDSVEVEAGSPADAVAFWGELLHEDPGSLEYVERTAADYSRADRARIGDAVRRVLWCFGGAGRRLVTKSPGLLVHIGLLRELCPGARFIHIVRDPRMTANSMIKLYRRDNEQLNRIRGRRRHAVLGDASFVPYPRVPCLRECVHRFGADDIRTTANVWRDGVEMIRAEGARGAALCEVRYEDLLADPHGETMRLLEFCELTCSDDVRERIRTRLATVGQVHHQNDYGQFDVVESICHAGMLHYGYGGTDQPAGTRER